MKFIVVTQFSVHSLNEILNTSMFNNYDPMETLENLQTQVGILNADKLQLVTAINHQAKALELMSKQISSMVEHSNIQDRQIKLLQAQMQNVSVIQNLGK